MFVRKTLIGLLLVFACVPPSTELEDELDPARIPDWVATRVTGRISAVYADDFLQPEQSRALYRLIEDEGDTFDLRFASRPPAFLQDGARVRIAGRQRGTELQVAAANADGSSSVEPIQVAAANVSGDQRTLVMVGDFTDAAVSCSAAAIQSLMFGANGSVDAYFRESSGGSVSVTGDVVGPFALPFANSGCNTSGWASALESAAAASGVNLSQYSRRVYVTPNGGCGFAGLGTIGGNPSQAWNTGYCQLPDVYAHELGHNFTMHHAATPTSEYGDTSCIMGIGGIGLRQPNAPHQLEMGWLTGASAALTSGSYQVAAVETTAAPQVVRIPRASPPDLYVSYRVPLGFDATILPSQYRNRVSIHEWAGGSANRTFLLAVLDPGQTFVDPATGANVLVGAIDGTIANFDLSFGCTTQAPTIAIAPASQGGGRGVTLRYDATVTNRDALGCPARTLDLAAIAPGGFTAVLSTSVLDLGPGQSGSTSIDVTSPLDAADGAASFTVEVRQSGQLVASGSASFIVDASAPSAPSNLAASTSRRSVLLAWSASSDNVGVQGYRVFRDGGELITVAATSFSDRAVSAGVTYTYEVEAFDQSGNTSARSNSVTVTVPRGGKRR